MFETLKNAWKIQDLRNKMLFTLAIILIFRFGAVAVPVPYLDPAAMQNMINGGGNLLGFINILSGGAFERATLFALGISPYITASIVIQLLTVAIPALERMAKEGEDGRKKINKITRYSTLGLGVLQAIAYYVMLRNENAVKYVSGFSGVFAAVVIVGSFTLGGLIVMWLGERIDEKGIGNGISMMLFSGIVSRGPHVIAMMYQYLKIGDQYYFFVPAIIALFVVVIGFIVLMTQAERRIPVTYAKRVVGRKMYGGQSTHIPIKVNMSGVMPIIFASSLLAIPGTIKAFVDPQATGFWGKLLGVFDYNKPVYAILYFLLIIAFNYFYVAIQYNPLEMANNLRRNNGAIPGIRPGKPTSDFIAKVISKVTLVGAIFLGLIAILPIALGAIAKMNIALGGTTIIIVVGVALDFVRQLESQMMMRHYKGFLE
ncbi:MAG: preprotein translocase subunit SecY [Clostridiales bacterium]|uniref:Protein translocase subunit SecY n=1 Tax=Harryflintia acetispora TaxID=1849041 RepID=A0A9X8UMC5_9FIRM|nr:MULTISPECIES: preprotein translocase subunit SecY [Oscillospiraceae]PWM36381.1 MAG: preprotein translocase subunit SecY [Clostridiales bacterium]RGB68735.1 preprotein translocase subunit SecY [Harryflintia acetispora]TCL45447.1 protein translocase subunit secY/sec61 alpha [Harryflintia acetispora]